MAEEAGEPTGEAGEAETITGPTTKTVPDVAVGTIEAVVQEGAEPKPARDTPPTHQSHAVTAITPTAPELGTAWPPPPAPGPTSAHPSNEIMTSLEEIKKKF